MSLHTALADARHGGMRAQRRLGDGVLGGLGAGDSPWHRGAQAHTGVYPSSAAFLWPRDEMFLPFPIAYTMCQTRPAELRVKCRDLCHF